MKYGSCRIRKSIEVNESRCSLRIHICCWLGASTPRPDTTVGTVVGNRRVGIDTIGETGPGVLSGTGQWLAEESGEETEQLRGHNLQVIHNGGEMEHRVMDTALLSGLSAG